MKVLYLKLQDCDDVFLEVKKSGWRRVSGSLKTALDSGLPLGTRIPIKVVPGDWKQKLEELGFNIPNDIKLEGSFEVNDY